MFFSRNKKNFIAILLIIFLFSTFASGFMPRTVKAQIFNATISDMPREMSEIIRFVDDTKDKVLKSTLATAFKKTIQMYLNSLAYKAATDLATGATGGKPRWYTQNWGEYLKDAGEAATAEFLDNLADGVGLDICQPPSGIDLKLKVSIDIASFEEPKPKCSLNDIKEKWGDLADQIQDNPLNLLKLNGKSLQQLGYGNLNTDQKGNEIAAQILQSFVSVKETDIGYIQFASQERLNEIEKRQKIVELKRTDPDGAKPKESTITRDTITPSQTAETDLTDLQKRPTESTKVLSDDMLANTANVFLNTLVSKTMQGMIENFFKVNPPHSGYDDATDSQPYTKPKEPNIVEKTFASIKNISYNINPKDIDVISAMEMDLGDDIVGEMNNGTIDSDFAEALRKAQGGQVLTLKEAIEEGLIDQNKWFGYVDVASQDPKQPSVAEGYSLNNIKKLVKNRVVSTGWIFAAEVIKEEKGNINGCSSKGCTLKNVMDNFDQSGTYQIEDEIYKDEYCGQRPISAEPYSIEINNANSCTADYLSSNFNLTGVDVEWVGRDTVSGICYEYLDDNNDSIIDSIHITDVYSQEECENYEPTVDRYYKWESGGCMIKEKDESPLCHLVDPYTVIKAPAQQCGAEGYYSILETNNASSRQEDCADVKHCIQEDDDGKCVGGYEYCLKEENIWRFSGDTCSSQYNSCTTLVDDEGVQESYLVNTLKDCPQEEVGCRDYVYQREKEGDNYVWNNDGRKLYFNDSVEECNADSLGCSEFIEIKPGINLLPNGSFEINEGPEDEEPDGWFWTVDDNFSLVRESYLGNYAVKHTGSDSDYLYIDYYDRMPEERVFYAPYKGLYTLSYYAKSNGSATISPKIVFNFKDGSSSSEIINLSANFEESSGWVRKSGYFSIPNINEEIKDIDIRFRMQGDVSIDGVQFELNRLEDSNINEGEGTPTVYKEYGQESKIYFKKAPDYLACEDYDLNSYNCAEEYHPCCDYLKYCPAEDLACSAYQPVNGDPFVPAVIKDEDRCVAECNNYQTFVVEPSYFDNLESLEQTGELALSEDNNFIPETAQDCSQPSCELFTNIDSLESGAESKEYYSAVRQCVKPDDEGVSVELYYTWEGSDTSAFQLKTWQLLASEEIDPLNNEGGYAPCTNVAIGGSACQDSNLIIEECDPETNFDCRTFYDANAIPHNRLLSQTIPITEECVNLRREVSNQVYKIVPSMSQACSASNVGCLTYKGNNSNNIQNIFFEDFESGTTLGWMADIENGSSNINLRHASEAIHYNGNSMKVWTADNSNAIWISYNLTNAGVNIPSGKQYILSFWAKSFGDNTSGNNHQATSYSTTSGSSQAFNSLFYNNVQAAEDDVLLSFDNSLAITDEEWLLYEYDLVDLQINSEDLGKDVILTFKINIDNTIYNYDGIYIDNILLKGLANSFDKIKDSWETPKVCLDNDYLGCQEYQDLDGNISYLFQFSDLCPEENVGCTAMIDTQNSSMPWQQTFNAYCGVGSSEAECDLGEYYYKNYTNVPSNNLENSTVVIPEDELVYVVKNNDYACLSESKGCQDMSIINNNGENQDINIINNPDYYIPYDIYGDARGILCLEEYKNCVSFQKLDGSKLNKIHPRNSVCNYQEKNLAENIPAGFFTEEGENCTGLLYHKDYDEFTSNINEEWKPYDFYEKNYAALCSADNDGCTNFIDPRDNLDLNDDVYNKLGTVLNYNNPSQWNQAWWSKNQGEISGFSSGGISYHLGEEEGTLQVVLSEIEEGENRNLLIYQGPDENKEAFSFNVESDSIYRLSAKVKLDDADSVMTFLSCRPSKDANYDNYFVKEEWYQDENGNPLENKIPYGFPAINSNYSTIKNSDGWQSIYGLYEILPYAHYCNLAFYVEGEPDSKFFITDINLEKVEGDYYYLDNDSLDYDSCNSANLKEGCVLFHNINDASLKWNYEQSYAEDRLVPGENDVNTLLKVTRDKQCAEWLTCGASLKSLDANTGKTKDACISLIACDELSDDQSGVCAHPFLHGQDAEPLTLDYYQQIRGKAGWADLDYSGYSIPGLYPLDTLNALEIGEEENKEVVLGHTVIKQNSNKESFVYKLGVGVDNYLHSVYSPGNLIYNQSMVEKTCRLYPEKDAPFPWIADTNIVVDIPAVTENGDAVYVDIQTKTANFANANICQTGSGSPLNNPNYPYAQNTDCECHYTKVNYGSEVLYFPYDYDDSHIPDSIKIDYGEGGTTLNFRSKTKYLGWKGFCLDQEQSLFINNTESLSANEQDYRCLSWYPVDLLSGETDAYTASQEAEVAFGKVPENSKLCLIGEDWTTTEDRIYCSFFDFQNDEGLDICTSLAYVPAGTKINKDLLNEYSFLLYPNANNERPWLDLNQENIDYLGAGDSGLGNPNAEIIYKTGQEEGFDGATGGLLLLNDFSGLIGNIFVNPDNQLSLDFTDILINLFDTTLDLKFFYYDEGISSDSKEWNYDRDTSGGEKKQKGGKIEAIDAVEQSQDMCEDGLCDNETCAQRIASQHSNQSDEWCALQGKHLVDWKCSSGGVCSLSNLEDDCEIICNPHKYNYYAYEGGEGSECSETDCTNPKGRECLRSGGPYASILENPSPNPADNNFVDCIENIIINNNYCSQYDSCLSVAFNENDYLILTEDLGIQAYGSTTLGIMGCLVSDIEADCEYDSYIYSEETIDCEPNNCGQVCKTYASLDNVIYNSNNFYLNWLAPDQISSQPYPQTICPENICPSVLSGDDENYGTEIVARFNEIASSTQQGVWDTIHEPFSASLGTSTLRDLILVSDRSSSSNNVFNDYYASLNEDNELQVAKNRLSSVVVKISNDNFYEWNDSSWINPNWHGTYWNTITPVEPFIKQTVYNEVDKTFTEGGSGISINSTHNQHIIAKDGNLYAHLMFYAYTAEGATPIQKIAIDWTGLNTDKLILEGPFKNHKHDCVRREGDNYQEAFPIEGRGTECFNTSNSCFAQTWGDREEACVEDNPDKSQDGYFSYSYIYTCDALNDYWQDDCTEYDSSVQGGCCVYAPTVTITDNWGNTKTEDLGNCDGKTCSIIVIPK